MEYHIENGLLDNGYTLGGRVNGAELVGGGGGVLE